MFSTFLKAVAIIKTPMNITYRHLIIAAVVVAAGAAAFFWFFQGDEARIKKRLNAFAALASKEPGEHDLTAALNAGRIGEMFADTCRVEIPAYNIAATYPGKEVSPRVMGARARYSEILLRFHDLDIRFPEKDTARVSFIVYAEGVQVSGEAVREIFDVVCRLEKIDNNWFFNHIEAVLVQ